MQDARQVEPLGCRSVSPGEVAHYSEHGWARLPGLVSPDVVARLLAMARERMGEDGQGNAVSAFQQPFFNPEATDGPNDPVLRPLLDGIGRNAVALMERGPGIGARYFGDFFAAKLPANQPTSHPGAGTTYFHQDFMNWAVDRSGGMTFWIALTDLAPESGTMAFLSGSHRKGALGHYRGHGEGGLLDDFPELRDQCPQTAPMHYRAGDATVHTNMTVHGAGKNLTDAPRWSYLVTVNPSDVRWTGAPPEAYATQGMVHLQRLDDQRFPALG